MSRDATGLITIGLPCVEEMREMLGPGCARYGFQPIGSGDLGLICSAYLRVISGEAVKVDTYINDGIITIERIDGILVTVRRKYGVEYPTFLSSAKNGSQSTNGVNQHTGSMVVNTTINNSKGD
ncbi:hypothetical protein AGMMS49992_11640 [Clostridia bacterium]|nr:hypothetical protein AGMMS49992_11640 [Clostridia bacterium]